MALFLKLCFTFSIWLFIIPTLNLLEMGFRNMRKVYLGALPTLNLGEKKKSNFYTNTNENSERPIIKL